MAIQRRAISDAQKQARRGAILAAAADIFAQRDYPDITMSEVAEAAQVVKGTLYLYFPSKEALFLALLAAQLEDWFAQMRAGLAVLAPGEAAIGQVVDLFDHTLAARPSLTRLLAILYSILEQGIDIATARAFKHWLREQMQALGAPLERALPFLVTQGGGAELLVACHALVVGLRSLADPAPVVRTVTQDPALSLFIVDFQPTFARMLRALLLGLAAQATAPSATGEQHT